MPYSTYADVRLIVDTKLTNANITSLIVLADQEIVTKQLTARAANDLKTISMLLTAAWIAGRDPYVRSVGDYREQRLTAKDWRELAKDHIRSTGPSPDIAANDPLPWE